MDMLRRSPFKVARVESDPHAFGRRIEVITDAATALYNRRNVLISGPRGIGKSSLGSQLQTVYEGDSTLLQRCHIDAALPRYVTAFYACDRTTTLAELSAAILYSVERRFAAAKSLGTGKKKVTIELDLKVFKAKLEADIITRGPATIATELVAGLSDAMRAVRLLGLDGINIFLDELDLLPEGINFGHFLKIVHETLGRERLDDVTFLFAGQRGIYSRLLREDESVERLVRHVPISTLDPDEALYVLEYAADHATQPFAIEAGASEMILAVSAGYPYDIHLLGDAAFNAMQEPETMTRADVLTGLGDLFRSDKREKYLERLRTLTEDERLAVVSLARYQSSIIPMHIPLDWLSRNLLGRLSEGARLEHVVDGLESAGHIVVNAKTRVCQFSEELFRIFVALLVLDQRELQEVRASKAKRVAEELRETEGRAERQRFLRDYRSDDASDIRMEEVLEALSGAEFEAKWEQEGQSELTSFE